MAAEDMFPCSVGVSMVVIFTGVFLTISFKPVPLSQEPADANAERKQESEVTAGWEVQLQPGPQSLRQDGCLWL